MIRLSRILPLCATVLAAPLAAQSPAFKPVMANRAVYLEKGVVRWKDDKSEVRLFGANYVVTTASDYRAAGYVGADRKQMIDEDMAHFARMGWDGIRLTFWGDWESADSAGNLIANDHLDLLDYLIARARERGIYMLFSPIQLYGSNWPDALSDTTQPGFGRTFGKEKMGKDRAAIAAQVNYLKQILNHVNPYTGVAIKDEPAIVFVELVNEPWHHPEEMAQQTRYINTLTDAVRSTGCKKLVFYNVSQDFRINPAVVKSKAQGVTFGWYPTGLNSGHELTGNNLRSVDDFPDMRSRELAALPRIVYEFDAPDLRESTMYPAMARVFRSVGTQFAAMFSYDMLRTASRNLGWQTHYLNLVYTPRKAMSAIIAAEAMRRLPRGEDYGPYPRNRIFGQFRLVPDSNLAELLASDAFLYAGTTTSKPRDVAVLRRVAGYGSSPVVQYDGEGIYFLDRIKAGVWRLEVYPDAVPVRDPFEMPSPDKIVTRALHVAREMTVDLPDLGGSFGIQVLSDGGRGRPPSTVVEGKFIVTPGVYLLSAVGPIDPSTIESPVPGVGLTEFHVLPPESLAPSVETSTTGEFHLGAPVTISARVVDSTPPDSVKLFLRQAAAGWYRGFWMERSGSYGYSATVNDLKAEGPYEYVITTYRGGSSTTWPERYPHQPWDWNYSGKPGWRFNIVADESRTALTLFDPMQDAGRLHFTRIGDAGRRGLYSLERNMQGRGVMRLPYPVDQAGIGPDDYTASMAIRDRIRARSGLASPQQITLELEGLTPGAIVHVTLLEDDGMAWTAAIRTGTGMNTHTYPLSDFAPGKGVSLPQGFPGQWNYWINAPLGRGGAGDRPRVERLERLQISLRKTDAGSAASEHGVKVGWVGLSAVSSGS